MRHAVLWAPPATPSRPPLDPPARAHVAVIGGGYTGLCAARAVAQAGGEAVVLERETIGAGASGRNAGFVLPGFQVGLEVLVRRYGLERARQLFADSLAAVALVERLITEERISCHWGRVGYLHLAAKPEHQRHLAEERDRLGKEFGYQTELLDRDQLRSELTSPEYHGGLLDSAAGALEPRAYLEGLRGAAARAGASLVEQVAVERIRRSGSGFRLETSRGVVQADHVVVATNGYTGTLHPWIARRIIPVGSFIIATAPLDPALARRLIPRGRVMADTRNLLRYFRLTPDGRLVFGGRAAFLPQAVDRSLVMLAGEIGGVFPELAAVPVEFGWGGRLGVTISQLPHLGRAPDGVHYALGLGGHGVANASWMGDRLGRIIAGAAEWPPLARTSFTPVPCYGGRPWFLPLVGAYFRLRDWIG